MSCGDPYSKYLPKRPLSIVERFPRMTGKEKKEKGRFILLCAARRQMTRTECTFLMLFACDMEDAGRKQEYVSLIRHLVFMQDVFRDVREHHAVVKP